MGAGKLAAALEEKVMAGERKLGDMTQRMFEYNDGIIVMSLAGRDAILAVVADIEANGGNVRHRHQVKKRLPEISKSM